MTDYYTYNLDTTINTRIRKDSDDKVYWDFEYKYEMIDGKRELTIYQYESDKKKGLSQEWYYKYDSIGRVVQEPYDHDGIILGFSKYKYFGNDSVHVKEFSMEGDSSDYVKSYAIDKDGNFVDNDKERTKFKYDKFGNWIEKEVLQQNNSWINYREIIYY